MAGGHAAPKPPSQNHSSSAVKPSSSQRNSSRVESSAPASSAKPSSHQKSSSSASAGAQKTNPTSNRDQATTIAKPPTPKVKPNKNSSGPSPKTDDPSTRFEPPASNLPAFPFSDPPPPPAYGFHMLDRRSIVLSDGSVRSYFALPPDYQEFSGLPPRPVPGFGFGRPMPMSPDFRGPGIPGERDDRFMRGRNPEFRNPYELEGRSGGPGPGEGSENFLKRKFGDDEIDGRDGFGRQRQKLLQYGNAGGSGDGMSGPGGIYMGRGDQTSSSYSRANHGRAVALKHNEVDQSALKKAFLDFVKTIYESTNQRKKYLADGKQGSLQCLACGRSSKGFSDMHELIMHAYNPENADSIVNHLGLHKALCVLMGWNYRAPPDNSKMYQLLPVDEAVANQEDLIMWPPLVIIHNTLTGKGRDHRMEGVGNRAMDSYIRDLGIGGGKSKSLYSKEGHLGITLIKFGGDQSGLKEAVHLAEHFERENHGRKSWAHVEPSMAVMDDEKNPRLIRVDERTGERKRIFYGYLGTVYDMDRLDFETKKKITIESMRELKLPN